MTSLPEVVHDDLFDEWCAIDGDPKSVDKHLLCDCFEFFFGDQPTAETFEKAVGYFIEHVKLEYLADDNHWSHLTTLSTELTDSNRDAVGAQLVASLPLIVWKSEYRTAFTVTAGDAATLVGATVKVITCRSVAQSRSGSSAATTMSADAQSPFDVHVFPMAELYSLSDDGDDAKHFDCTRDDLVVELLGTIEAHTAAWEKKMKTPRDASLCPATVAAAALSMLKRRSQNLDDDHDTIIIDPSDVGFVLLASTMTKSQTPRDVRWSLFCAVVRDLLPHHDRIATVLLATFIFKMISDDVTLLRLSMATSEEHCTRNNNSEELRRRSIDIRRRLSKRQQALQHCASFAASDLHDSASFAQLTHCTESLKNVMNELRCLDSRSATNAQHTFDHVSVKAAVMESRNPAGVFPFTPQPSVLCIPDNVFPALRSIGALPSTLHADPRKVEWPKDAALCRLHIEHIACSELHSFNNNKTPSLPPYEIVHHWWDLYEKNAQTEEPHEWGILQTKSRRLVIGMIFWYFVEESMKAETPVVASKYTTMPTDHLITYLQKHVVDVHSSIHQSRLLLIVLLVRKSSLEYAGKPPATLEWHLLQK
jgi:hypothetical protein